MLSFMASFLLRDASSGLSHARLCRAQACQRQVGESFPLAEHGLQITVCESPGTEQNTAKTELLGKRQNFLEAPGFRGPATIL